MAQGGSRTQLEIIILGRQPPKLVETTRQLAEQSGMACVCSEDVYSAVVAVAAGPGGLVVGPFAELNKEQGRFFEIARRNGFACCCYLDDDLSTRRTDLPAALERGAFLITDAAQIRDILTELSRCVCPAHRPGESEIGEPSDRIRRVVEKIIGVGPPRPVAQNGPQPPFVEHFRTTQDELNALFGR